MTAYVWLTLHNALCFLDLRVARRSSGHARRGAGILRHFEVRECLDSEFLKEGSKWAAFRTRVNSETTSEGPIRIRRGADLVGPLDWGSELDVEVLYAYPGNSEGLGSGSTLENNASIVLRVAYGSQSFLFMGDA